MKNVLITGATSEIAVLLIKKLLEKNVIVYALSRSELMIEDELLKKTRIDLTDEFAINNYFVMPMTLNLMRLYVFRESQFPHRLSFYLRAN